MRLESSNFGIRPIAFFVALSFLLCLHSGQSFSTLQTTTTNTGRRPIQYHSNHARSSTAMYSSTSTSDRFWSVFQKHDREKTTASSIAARLGLRDTSSFRIVTKSRPQVTVNTTTGQVTEISSAPPPPTIITTPQRGKWNTLKQSFYSTLDVFTSLSGKNNGEPPIRPNGGYRDLIEAKMKVTTPQTTPGQRLMTEYQELTSPVLSSPTLDKFQQEMSYYDTIKEGLYSTFDNLSKTKNSDEPKRTPPVTGFKPIAKPSIAASPKVKEALLNLSSKNPIKRFMAERTVANWDAQKQRYEAALKRQESLQSLKDGLYGFVDAIESGAKTVASVPDVVVQAATATQQAAMASYQWAASIPDAVEETVEAVTSIPKKVETSVKNQERSIRSTIQASRQFASDVQAIPDKVQNSVKVVNTSVAKIATNVKILVGAEERKPHPPKIKPPAPRSSASTIALRLTSVIVTGSAKAVWFVGSKSAQVAYKALRSSLASNNEIRKQKEIAAKSAFVQFKDLPVSTSNEEMTLKDISLSLDEEITAALVLAQQSLDNSDHTVDSEVSAALKLSEEALRMANDGRTYSNSAIDTSLRLAKEAAVRATMEAVLIERSRLKPK